MGTGSLLAFPGSMAGAFLGAVLFRYTGKVWTNFAGEILGENEGDTVPHFIRVPYEKGQLLLNVKPVLFTNHAVLDSVRGDYYYKALSALPVNTEIIIWDAYRTKPPMPTPLRVILKYPALKLALYLVLAGALLYVLFRIKREQRAVPVILPPKTECLSLYQRSVCCITRKRNMFRWL